MKSINIKKSIGLMLISTLFACDFDEKNINPNSSSTIEPGPLLTYVQLNTTNPSLCKRTQVGYCMMLVQQTASLEREEMAGDKYYETETLGEFFTITYTIGIKNVEELLKRTREDEIFSNTHAVAKIWKAFLYHRLTDLYGDIPYNEAGRGYESQLFYPRYDTQQAIYTAMIDEIEGGLSLLDDKKPPIVSGDIIYNGNITQWRKFANSLLLRMGMRLEKADPDLAKEVVKRAIERGVMTSPEDICMIQHVAGRTSTENPLGYIFQSHGLVASGMVKIGKTFMAHLQRTNDPRMSVYCALADGNIAIDKQKGLPNGYDIMTIRKGEPGYTSLADYSTFNPATILQLDAPTIHLTHAETELLHAEAILKGWVGGNAAAHYEEAVRSSMKQQAVYGESGIISNEAIEAYLSQQLFDKAKTITAKLGILGHEFWVASFMNGYESYANWRRTGYPRLFPVNYSVSPNKGSILRRFKYPISEYSINKANVEEVLSRQGADKMSTPVWWDKNN